MSVYKRRFKIQTNSKIDGFRNPLLKIDGYPGTHGTHANGATVIALMEWMDPKNGENIPLERKWAALRGGCGLTRTHCNCSVQAMTANE